MGEFATARTSMLKAHSVDLGCRFGADARRAKSFASSVRNEPVFFSACKLSKVRTPEPGLRKLRHEAFDAPRSQRSASNTGCGERASFTEALHSAPGRCSLQPLHSEPVAGAADHGACATLCAAGCPTSCATPNKNGKRSIFPAQESLPDTNITFSRQRDSPRSLRESQLRECQLRETATLLADDAAREGGAARRYYDVFGDALNNARPLAPDGELGTCASRLLPTRDSSVSRLDFRENGQAEPSAEANSSDAAAPTESSNAHESHNERLSPNRAQRSDEVARAMCFASGHSRDTSSGASQFDRGDCLEVSSRGPTSQVQAVKFGGVLQKHADPRAQLETASLHAAGFDSAFKTGAHRGSNASQSTALSFADSSVDASMGAVRVSGAPAERCCGSGEPQRRAPLGQIYGIQPGFPAVAPAAARCDKSASGSPGYASEANQERFSVLRATSRDRLEGYFGALAATQSGALADKEYFYDASTAANSMNSYLGDNLCEEDKLAGDERKLLHQDNASHCCGAQQAAARDAEVAGYGSCGDEYYGTLYGTSGTKPATRWDGGANRDDTEYARNLQFGAQQYGSVGALGRNYNDPLFLEAQKFCGAGDAACRYGPGPPERLSWASQKDSLDDFRAQSQFNYYSDFERGLNAPEGWKDRIGLYSSQDCSDSEFSTACPIKKSGKNARGKRKQRRSNTQNDGFHSDSNKISQLADSFPPLPGLYFDKKQKGFRVRYQNVYVGWVALSRFDSIEEAYCSARVIWENAKASAEKFKTPHAAVIASLPLQNPHGKNRGGRPRTVTQLPLMQGECAELFQSMNVPYKNEQYSGSVAERTEDALDFNESALAAPGAEPSATAVGGYNAAIYGLPYGTAAVADAWTNVNEINASNRYYRGSAASSSQYRDFNDASSAASFGSREARSSAPARGAFEPARLTEDARVLRDRFGFAPPSAFARYEQVYKNQLMNPSASSTSTRDTPAERGASNSLPGRGGARPSCAPQRSYNELPAPTAVREIQTSQSDAAARGAAGRPSIGSYEHAKAYLMQQNTISACNTQADFAGAWDAGETAYHAQPAESGAPGRSDSEWNKDYEWMSQWVQ